MHTKPDSDTIHFEVGDFVREIGMRQSMRVVDCRHAMLHIHMETPKTIHYRCVWRGPGGREDAAWFPAERLQKAW